MATPSKKSPSLYYSKWARELANTCLYDQQERTQVNDDLANGGLGCWAYLQYELSRQHCNTESQRLLFLQSARDACLECLQDNNQEDSSSSSSSSSCSILTNSTIGAHALLTVIYNQLNQPYDARDQLRLLLKEWKKESNDVSLWTGLAGALQGIFFLRRELASPKGASELVIDIAIRIFPLLNDKIDHYDNSMKHGKLGILYTLLGLETDEWKAVEKNITGAKQKIQIMVDTISLPENEKGDDSSWESGTAGKILLLVRACQVFGNQDYLERAKQLAKEELVLGCDKTQLGLSKGVVGVAYTLRCMGQDAMVEKLVEFCIGNWKDAIHDEDSSFGIFDGLGGLVLLLMDMADDYEEEEKSNDRTRIFPFLHPPLSTKALITNAKEEVLFGESDLLAIDNFNFRGKDLSPKEQESSKMDGRLCDLQDSHFPFFATQQQRTASTDSLQAGDKAPRSMDGDTRIHVPSPEPTTPIASPNISFNYASPTTNSGRRMASKYTPNTTSKWMVPSPLKPAAVKSAQPRSPLSPPRPRRLNIDKSAIAKHHRRDLNGRLARRTLDKCLQNTDAGGSLLTGGLGVRVLLRLKMSQTHPQDSTNTLKAALAEAETALEMTESRKGTFRVSVFTGEYVGAKSLYIATLYHLDRIDEALDHALELLEKLEDACSKLPVEDCDVMDGRAGALKTIWFLRQQLDDPSFGRDFALRTSQKILIQGMITARKRNSSSLLMWEWRGKPYLGAAHGVVGIIHSLLGHSNEEWDLLDKTLPRVRDVILQAIDSLKGCCHESGNLRKKLDGEEEDEFASLAHGAPGYCLVLIKAAEVFPSCRNDFLKSAREIAEMVLQPTRVTSVQVGLMRGISGYGYVFLSLARLDDVQHRAKWIKQAEELAHSATNDLESLISYSRRPYSLFEGIGGLASLLLDLMEPAESYLPMFEVIPKVAKIRHVIDGDAATASTKASTRCNTPFKSPGKREPLSPLTDPHVTPEKASIPAM